MPGRPCTICKHPKRNEIETAIANQSSYRNIAKLYQVSITALFRHIQSHLAEAVKTAIVAAEEKREVRSGINIIDQFQRNLVEFSQLEKQADKFLQAALEIFQKAKQSGSMTAKVISFVQSALEATAKIHDRSLKLMELQARFIELWRSGEKGSENEWISQIIIQLPVED